MTTEFLEGDLVEAVKGEERHIGRLHVSRHVNGFILGAPGGNLDWFAKEGFTLTLIERPKPKVELPSEDGVYLSRTGAVWVVEAGELRWVDDDQCNPVYAKNYAPFTRLESRADTAKAVLTALNSLSIQTVGRDEPQRIIRHEWWNKVAAEFGVTDA